MTHGMCLASLHRQPPTTLAEGLLHRRVRRSQVQALLLCGVKDDGCSAAGGCGTGGAAPMLVVVDGHGWSTISTRHHSRPATATPHTQLQRRGPSSTQATACQAARCWWTPLCCLQRGVWRRAGWRVLWALPPSPGGVVFVDQMVKGPQSLSPWGSRWPLTGSPAYHAHPHQLALTCALFGGGDVEGEEGDGTRKTWQQQCSMLRADHRCPCVAWSNKVTRRSRV